MKKLLLTMGLGIISIVAFSSSAYALDSIGGAANDFSSAWERYASGDGGRANLVFGYNTFLINEDYSWATHSSKRHYAQVANGTGNHFGPDLGAGGTSKIEVVHSGSLVGYANFFY